MNLSHIVVVLDGYEISTNDYHNSLYMYVSHQLECMGGGGGEALVH